MQTTKTPMNALRNKISSLPACIVLSLLGHLLAIYAVDLLSPFELRGPVRERPAVSLILEETDGTGLHGREDPEGGNPPNQREKPTLPDYEATDGHIQQSDRQAVRQTMAVAVGGNHRETTQESIGAGAAESAATEEGRPTLNLTVQAEEETASNRSASFALTAGQTEKGIRQSSEFMAESREKLVYRITLRGIPAGTAVIEARNAAGELRITARVTSNEFVSAFYPVDDVIDTRLIRGNYLVTRIRQREGGVVSDTGFTLQLRERNAFWVDRIRERYLNTPLPREDVTDLFTGFYYLRNLPLEVGTSEVLHLFDGDRYAPTVVAVVRRERLDLPGLREADTILVHPKLSASGFFSRTGPLSIWLTDDEKRVPVRLETSISWGRVRMELVSAESDPTRP